MRYSNIACLASVVLAQAAPLYAQQKERPNIIWITCEDISPYMSAYGADVVNTPNIDRLAADGIQFQSMYTTAGVSAPSRSCLITGMYPTSIGTGNMRTKVMNPKTRAMLGQPAYSACLPADVRCFSELMRMDGYYCTNCQKEDYQFDPPVTAWDESSPAATYRNRPDGKPFFSVFNLFVTHESQLFNQSYLFKEHPELLLRADQIKSLPPYYKDTQTAREAWARMLSNSQMMDWQVGQIIKQLKEDGLYDNSYIFFFSDHGGTLPWMKREILERGTHIPFIVKLPKSKMAGTKNNDLLSEVDIAPTVLSLAGVQIPDYMQGQAFMGTQAVKTKRKYVFAGRDRMDECRDRVRSVRDSRFRYIYNFHPELPKYQDISYRRGMPMMQEMLTMYKEGKLNDAQADWFKPSKPQEELYDVVNDPDEIHNLATDSTYHDKLVELRKAFRTWINEVGDMGYIPEPEMIRNWWKGEDHEPLTAEPVVKKQGKGYVIECATEGASIGYKIMKVGQKDAPIERKTVDYDMALVTRKQPHGSIVKVSTPWAVYKKGQVISLKSDEYLLVNAHRIGYTPSVKEFKEK